MNEPWMEFQGKDQISLTKYVRSLFRSIRFLTEICKLWNFLFFQLMKQVLTMLFCCKRTMKLKKHCETLLMIFHIMIIARKVGNVSEKNKRVFVIQSEKASPESFPQSRIVLSFIKQVLSNQAKSLPSQTVIFKLPSVSWMIFYFHYTFPALRCKGFFQSEVSY